MRNSRLQGGEPQLEYGWRLVKGCGHSDELGRCANKKPQRCEGTHAGENRTGVCGHRCEQAFYGSHGEVVRWACHDKIARQPLLIGPAEVFRGDLA